MTEHSTHQHRHEAAAIDPVCGMTVDPHTAKHRAEHRGHTYYFCSAGCQTKFTADPQKYLGRAKAAEPVAEGTIYTCPMHPQIRQAGPRRLPDLRHGAGAGNRQPPTAAPIPNSPT